MFVKSYFASSVDEGMAQARADMGVDALLLNSREAPAEARHLGDYEVVFGMTTEVNSSPVFGERRQMDDLRQQMDEIRALVARMANPSREAGGCIRLLADALIDAGVDIELAREIGESVWRRVRARMPLQMGRRHLAEPDPSLILSEMLEDMSGRFKVLPELERVTTLVGPPGSGKTTMIVKLAIAQGLAVGRPVNLLSIDHYRIAAVEQLRTYAAILGVSFQACETTVALAHAIESAPVKALVLIDTPGYSRVALQESSHDLASFLSQSQNIDTHLVLTASMRARDLRPLADAYQVFSPSKLLFTRLDETEAYGSMFSEAVRLQLPLSFVSAGQVVPEDLGIASKETITASLVKELPNVLRAVA